MTCVMYKALTLTLILPKCIISDRLSLFMPGHTSRQEIEAPRNFRQLAYEGGGHAVAQLVEAVRYKPEGRGFDS